MRKTPLRRTSKKRKVKLSASWYRAKLDEVCKANIRSIGVCEAQGMFGVECSSQLHAHHISRCRHSVNRWYEGNLVCLCYAHHMYIHDHGKAEVELVDALYSPEPFTVKQVDENGIFTGKVFTGTHYEYMIWREYNEPFKCNLETYEKLLEYWQNKPSKAQ